MDLKLLFKNCLATASAVIKQVKPNRYYDLTPDTEWNVLALVKHMLSELSWAADILDGKTVADVGTKYDGDLIGDDLFKNWTKAANRALNSLAKVDLNQTVHLSFGDFNAAYYIQQQGNDQLIHAWDLGQAIQVSVKFDPVISKYLYEAALPHKRELAASGLFAPAIKVPESATIQTKLLALLGRRSQD
ncbi:MAG: TIGR03086 family metal-binding protein [Candidatus Saccharimonadales bacterium]|jgi:uncharacterized protein (TIGR03086 family)